MENKLDNSATQNSTGSPTEFIQLQEKVKQLELEKAELQRHLLNSDGDVSTPVGILHVLRQINDNALPEGGSADVKDCSSTITLSKNAKVERSLSLECVALIDVDRMSLDEEDSWLYNSSKHSSSVGSSGGTKDLSPYIWMRQEFEQSPNTETIRRSMHRQLDRVNQLSRSLHNISTSSPGNEPARISLSRMLSRYGNSEIHEAAARANASMPPKVTDIKSPDTLQMDKVVPIAWDEPDKLSAVSSDLKGITLSPSDGHAENKPSFVKDMAPNLVSDAVGENFTNPRSSQAVIQVGLASKKLELCDSGISVEASDSSAGQIRNISTEREMDRAKSADRRGGWDGLMPQKSKVVSVGAGKPISTNSGDINCASEENLLKYRLNDLTDVKALAKLQEDSLRQNFMTPLGASKGLSKSLNRSSGALAANVPGPTHPDEVMTGSFRNRNQSTGTLLDDSSVTSLDRNQSLVEIDQNVERLHADPRCSIPAKIDNASRNSSRSASSLPVSTNLSGSRTIQSSVPTSDYSRSRLPSATSRMTGPSMSSSPSFSSQDVTVKSRSSSQLRGIPTMRMTQRSMPNLSSGEPKLAVKPQGVNSAAARSSAGTPSRATPDGGRGRSSTAAGRARPPAPGVTLSSRQQTLSLVNSSKSSTRTSSQPAPTTRGMTVYKSPVRAVVPQGMTQTTGNISRANVVVNMPPSGRSTGPEGGRGRPVSSRAAAAKPPVAADNRGQASRTSTIKAADNTTTSTQRALSQSMTSCRPIAPQPTVGRNNVSQAVVISGSAVGARNVRGPSARPNDVSGVVGGGVGRVPQGTSSSSRRSLSQDAARMHTGTLSTASRPPINNRGPAPTGSRLPTPRKSSLAERSTPLVVSSPVHDNDDSWKEGCF